MGNDGVADKIEKSRRGNGLDGKRRGSRCEHVEQQVPGGLGLSWNCHLVKRGGLGVRRGPRTRGAGVRNGACAVTPEQLLELRGLPRGPGAAKRRSRGSGS